MTIGIDTYISDPNLIKTHDEKVRIYRMKKVNIDYDFKKYGPHGTDFEVAEGGTIFCILNNFVLVLEDWLSMKFLTTAKLTIFDYAVSIIS